MEQNSPRELESGRFDQFEDEIELMDYLKVIWKWKYLILVGTMVCAIGAAVISLNMTKVYSIGTVLTPGVAKVEANGKITYIGSPQEIKTLIETGALETRVLRNVKVSNKEDLPKSLEFKVKTTKRSNALEISYETPDIDLGLQILNGLNEALLGKFDGLVRYFKEEYDIQVHSKSSEGSKIVEKTDKAKNNISTAEAENRGKISEIEARISSKNSEMATNEAEKEGKISEIENKISSKNSEMATNEAEKEGKISEIENKISSKNSEMATNEAEKEGKISEIENKISSKNSEMAAKEAEKNAAIEQKSNNILTIQAQVEAKKKQIKNLKDRISDLRTEIGRVSKNTDMLLEERDKFLSSTKNDNNILASVMYTTTIQQNIGYLNSLRSNVNNVNHQIFQEHVGIEKLENSIKDIGVQKVNLEKQTKIINGTLLSDIEDLQVQKINMEKQTKISNEKLVSDIKDFESQKTNLEKQTKINNGKLRADIEDLQAQKINMEKQTKIDNQKLVSDIKDLQSQIASLQEQTKAKTETLRSEIRALESEKKYILEEIKNFEFKKNYVQNIEILQPPKSSLSPVKPKTRLNVMLAGVVGLFLTVFLAFFVEYVSKYKNKEQD